MAVYRSNYLKEKIGIIPKNLYHGGNKPYSKSSLEWLEFISAQTNSKILHAVNGGEKMIVDTEWGKTYHVDGFCEETGTVYEFYGCVYHGCPLCFDGRNDHPFHSERKMCDVYEETVGREERLRALRLTVKSIWEHDYRKLRETEYADYTSLYPFVNKTKLYPLAMLKLFAKILNLFQIILVW
jgi:hypothetical protein